MDAELALLIECHRRRRASGEALLLELGAALAAEHYAAPEPKQRLVPAAGYREIGLARFRRTRVVSVNESRNRT